MKLIPRGKFKAKRLSKRIDPCSTCNGTGKVHRFTNGAYMGSVDCVFCQTTGKTEINEKDVDFDS